MSGGVWGRDLPDVYAGDLSLCLQIKPNCPLTHPQLRRENTDPTPRPAHPRGSSETLGGGGQSRTKRRKEGLPFSSSWCKSALPGPLPSPPGPQPRQRFTRGAWGKVRARAQTKPPPVRLGTRPGDSSGERRRACRREAAPAGGCRLWAQTTAQSKVSTNERGNPRPRGRRGTMCSGASQCR